MELRLGLGAVFLGFRNQRAGQSLAGKVRVREVAAVLKRTRLAGGGTASRAGSGQCRIIHSVPPSPITADESR